MEGVDEIPLRGRPPTPLPHDVEIHQREDCRVLKELISLLGSINQRGVEPTARDPSENGVDAEGIENNVTL